MSKQTVRIDESVHGCAARVECLCDVCGGQIGYDPVTVSAGAGAGRVSVDLCCRCAGLLARRLLRDLPVGMAVALLRGKSWAGENTVRR